MSRLVHRGDDFLHYRGVTEVLFAVSGIEWQVPGSGRPGFVRKV